jgi:hypothetical protein
MFDLKALAIATGAAFVVGGGLAGLATYKYEEARWTAATAALKIEAGAKLLKAEQEARAAESAANQIKDAVEGAHNATLEKLAAVRGENAHLARLLGGLRDPGRRVGGAGNVPGSTDPTAGSAATATLNRLSAEATEFLLAFAADADAAAAYANTCHAWVTKSSLPRNR